MSEPVSQSPEVPASTPQAPLICYCFSVNEKTLEAAVRFLGAKTVQDLNRATRAGLGCHGCWPDLEDLLARCTAGRFKYQFSAEEIAALVAQHKLDQQEWWGDPAPAPNPPTN